MTDKRPGAFSAFIPPGSSTAIAWAVAAILAFASLWVGQLCVLSRAENRLLRDQQQFAELELRDVSQHAEAERLLARRELIDASAQIERLTNRVSGTRREGAPTGNTVDTAQGDARRPAVLDGYTITLLSPAGSRLPAARAVAIWNSRIQQGVLRVEGLPAAAPGHAYRLWLADPSLPSPVDGGMVTVDSATGVAQVSFYPRQRINGTPRFMVSLEAESSGVSQPAGPAVLSGG